MERYEALRKRAAALGSEAERLVTGSVNVSNTAARVIAADVAALLTEHSGLAEIVAWIRGDEAEAIIGCAVNDGESVGDALADAIERHFITERERREVDVFEGATVVCPVHGEVRDVIAGPGRPPVHLEPGCGRSCEVKPA